MIKSYFYFFTNQVHPDPKFPSALAVNSLNNLSKLVHLASILFSNYPVGSDLKGLMQNQ
jgi:hypothetical protein